MSISVHPIIRNENALPFVIQGIGSQEKQCFINRTQGYPHHQLIFTYKGSGHLHTIYGDHTIKEGDFFYLRPNEPHSYHAVNNQWSTHWLLFSGVHINIYLERLNLNVTKIGHFGYDTTIEDDIFNILSTLKSKDPLSDVIASNQLYFLLIKLAKNLMNDDKDIRVSQNPLDNVIVYIDEFYQKNISLKELAILAGITEQHLCKLFKTTFELRPFEYIRKRRLQAAKQLLFSSNAPIKEIANLVGYENASYFGAIFKKEEGMTPRQYRGK